MKLRLQIALRNVLRNRRRTLLNILMIGAGVAAIIIFDGFTNHLVWQLQEVTINAQYGHLQIASEKTWKLSSDDTPKDRLIRLKPELIDQLKKDPDIDYVSGRISYYGLINSGDRSTSARAVGFDPGVEVKMRDHLRMFEGSNLSKDSKFQIIIGVGLRNQLQAKIGSQITLLAYTFDGSINAVDAELVGIFQSGLAELDNSTYFVSLGTAQKLLDTDAVERLVIQLKETDKTDLKQSQIAGLLPPEIGVRSWHELSTFFRQVIEFFGIQKLVIKWVLMLLALLAVANNVGMSIAERTGEIGTVRAMGDTRRTVLLEFLLEGLMLGAMGGIFGCLLGWAIGDTLTALKIAMPIPGASLPVKMVVDILPWSMFEAVVLMSLMATLATVVPALSASRMKIVDALRRNI